MRSFCSGYPGSIILGHGHITLPAYREGLTYRVFSAEQGKSGVHPWTEVKGVVAAPVRIAPLLGDLKAVGMIVFKEEIDQTVRPIAHHIRKSGTETARQLGRCGVIKRDRLSRTEQSTPCSNRRSEQ